MPGSDARPILTISRTTVHRRHFLKLGLASAGAFSLPGCLERRNGGGQRPAPLAAQPGTAPGQPIYCCIYTEFIQPWEQNEAIRQVKQLGLGNVVALTETFHVGNSDEDRRLWKLH